MCGRVPLSSDVSEIQAGKLVFSIPPHRPTPNFPPTWNGAPTDPLPVVRYDAKVGERSLDLLRWGLVPYWAKDLKVGFANINAKAEGIENKPAFRDAFQRRRCLVPVDSFYEWKKIATRKQPYAIALANRGLMALAGLWENWRSPAGEWIRSFAIVATTPNELCAELHNRMPAILAPETWPAWLAEEPADPQHLEALLAPYPSEAMTCWPVNARVGNVKNNDASPIEPIAAEQPVDGARSGGFRLPRDPGALPQPRPGPCALALTAATPQQTRFRWVRARPHRNTIRHSAATTSQRSAPPVSSATR
jgi:putative SOS response-associated peptidase YedK